MERRLALAARTAVKNICSNQREYATSALRNAINNNNLSTTCYLVTSCVHCSHKLFHVLWRLDSGGDSPASALPAATGDGAATHKRRALPRPEATPDSRRGDSRRRLTFTLFGVRALIASPAHSNP